MRFRLLFAAIILALASSCAPRVLCPAYSMEDSQTPQKSMEIQKEM